MRKKIIVLMRKRYLIGLLFLLALIFLAGGYFIKSAFTPKVEEFFSPLSIVGKKIFLDPGHGGEDPGCNDPRLGIYEKDINLKAALITRHILNQTGAQVIMSRESDRDYVLPKDQRGSQTKKLSDLTARINMSVDAKAEIFVSLHVNSTRKRSYAGAEAFYNPADPYSQLLAQDIQNHLRNIPGMTKRTAKPGNYYLLKNTPMPSVIVEMGCLSNSKEKQMLITESYQQELAQAVSCGLVDYFKDRSMIEESPAALQVLTSGMPRVAIIIDDLGTEFNQGLEQIFALNQYPFTLAIMPDLDKTKEYAQKAEEAGFEVLIHMPTESVQGMSTWLGPDAIKHNMGKEEVKHNLERALEQIPNAIGLDNHMGSLITQKKEYMLPVMEFLRDQDMFCLDSRIIEGTVGKDVVREVAQEVGVPYAERTHFLDNNYDYNSIRNEILHMAEYAQKNGSAIGICHMGPHGLNTAKALADTLPLLEEEGIEIVFVSDLIMPPAP